SIFQHDFLQSRIFVNLEAESVTCSVEKSDVLTLSHFGRIAALLEQRLDRLVNFHSIDAVLDFTKRKLLSVFDRLPKFALCFAGAPAHNRPRHIAPITASRVARKNIENDQ